MAFRNDIVIFVLLLGDILTVCFAIDVFSKPQILLKGREDIVEANTNYTIFCQGNSPLKWTTPTVKPEKRSWTQFRTEKETPPNSNFKYGLRLFITNMSYPFVGFYNCHFEDYVNITDENEENSRVYLYVNDKNQLEVNDAKLDNVYVRQGETVIIPCRPTAPDVEVKLFSVDFDFVEIPFDVLGEDDHVMYRYHPFYGIFSNATQNEGETLLRCQFRRDGVELRELIYLTVEQRTTYIPAPSISDENKGHTVVGDTIRLNCSLRYAKISVMFTWITPSGPFDPQRMNQTSTLTDSLLTIRNASIADNGVYVCQVSDRQNHHASKNITMKIFGKNVVKNQLSLVHGVG